MSDHTYDLPDEIQVEADGAIRVIRLNRPDDLNATNHVLHAGLAGFLGRHRGRLPPPGDATGPPSTASSRRARPAA